LDLTTITLAHGVDPALALIPAAPGVGQILADGERNLVIGRPANLRKWTAGHLGRARAPRTVPGKLPPRPPTDLTPIATAVAYAVTSSPFAQRLAYERLMARYVPLSKRRDLKRPAFLRLAPDGIGYPHLLVQSSREGPDVFGPFRDTRAATRARDALYKHFQVRPCDFDFNPASGLPAGLAADVARLLSGGGGVVEVPPWVGRGDSRSLVADRSRAGTEIFVIAGGSVIDGAMRTATPETLEAAIEPIVSTMRDDGATVRPDDTPWLNAWRHGKHTGIEIPIAANDSASDIAARLRQEMEKAGTSSK
jgi:hypothetical protein